jgi:hypothetical protein
LEDLVGAGSDAEVAGEIDPADGAGGIEQELGGASDIVAIDAGAFMQEVVAPDGFGVGVGKKRVGVVGLAAEILGLGGRVDTNGNRPDA